MEPVPGSETDYRFVTEGMERREEILAREYDRIERQGYLYIRYGQSICCMCLLPPDDAAPDSLSFGARHPFNMVYPRLRRGAGARPFGPSTPL
jgi:hypothetical protein